MTALLKDATADGDGDTVLVSRGTLLTVHAYGTFDGATVSVYSSAVGKDDDAKVLDTNLSFTSNGLHTVLVSPGITFWANVSSAGSSTEVSCVIRG